jgi:hypothetical protein
MRGFDINKRAENAKNLHPSQSFDLTRHLAGRPRDERLDPLQTAVDRINLQKERNNVALRQIVPKVRMDDGQGSSVSGLNDMTRGIHKDDLEKAISHVRATIGEYNNSYQSKFNGMIDDCTEGNPVKATLIKWQEGTDEILQTFANKALEEAETRRRQNWHND